MTVYDTLVVANYVYPSQAPMQVDQCGGNPFLFTTPVNGGLSPYSYQIIGNTPALPSLQSVAQSDSMFNIGNGWAYQTIRVRTIDRCGNSTIGDINVLQMLGCSWVLPVDTIQKDPTINNKLAKLFPNPSKEYFTISFSQRKKTDYKIEILNALGITVYENVEYGVDRKDVVINNRLAPGLYVINIYDLKTGKSSTFKQIVR